MIRQTTSRKDLQGLSINEIAYRIFFDVRSLLVSALLCSVS